MTIPIRTDKVTFFIDGCSISGNYDGVGPCEFCDADCLRCAGGPGSACDLCVD